MQENQITSIENKLKYTYLSQNSCKERLDFFLTRIIGYKRSSIQNLIRRKFILVNKEIVKCGYLLKLNDEIEVHFPPPIEQRLVAKDIPLEIIFQDQDLAVVNKPIGLVVHPALGHTDNTMVNALLFHFKELSDVNQDCRLGIVHRLDKDTEGLLVVAKNNQAHLSLTEQFKDRSVTKKYYALVHGIVKDDFVEINAPIGRDPKNRKKFRVITDNQNLKVRHALTYVKVIERFPKKTLLEVEIKTGRTHQIRVHLFYLGFPIVGDKDYTFKSHHEKAEGQLLQAYYLGFDHPETKKRLEFKLPLSERIKNHLM
jgi:23S rRNA pseudouridine1911/1915/1917 synthase